MQIAHSKHLLSCLRPTCIGALVALYQSATKKPTTYRIAGLISFCETRTVIFGSSPKGGCLP
nr:MAG TPA: hypothetical protein [Caudoviricetes sp.]DAW13513.1 MAG TPA: hypothetical protein [Caudoviricetes sp.]